MCWLNTCLGKDKNHPERIPINETQITDLTGENRDQGFKTDSRLNSSVLI